MYIIAGKYHRHLLVAPKGEKTRPTASRLRETVFNMLQMHIEGAEFLDIFAGSGAMGIEALSRGANHATFIDNSREAVKSIQTNLAQLKIEKQGKVLYGDWRKQLEKLPDGSFDIVYADAPYALKEGSSTLSEFLVEWFSTHNLLKPGGFLLIEDECHKAPEAKAPLVLLNSRKSGKAGLHFYQRMPV